MQRVNFARVLAQLWGDGLIKGPRKNGDASTKHPPDASRAATKSRYLFLDEPLTFLDIKHQIDFLRKVRAFSDAPDVVTIGVVHDLNLAVRFADHIVLLDKGRIVAAGVPLEVLTADRIREVFAVEATFVTAPDGTVHLVFE